jgi:hypothetical protein
MHENPLPPRGVSGHLSRASMTPSPHAGRRVFMANSFRRRNANCLRRGGALTLLQYPLEVVHFLASGVWLRMLAALFEMAHRLAETSARLLDGNANFCMRSGAS